jgi:hypothetical protein
MLDRATRLAPLTGIAFVVLVIIGGPVLQQTLPADTASPSAVVAFYSVHRDRERVAVYVLAFALVAFLYFAAALRTRWRGLPGCEGLATLLVASAAIEVVGQGTGSGVVYALTADPNRLEPSTAHALNLLESELVVVSAVGFLLIGLTAGLLILRGPGLVPSWLGWVSFPIGVLFLVPPVEFVGFLLLLVWVVVMAVLLVRTREPVRAAPLAEPASA